MTLSLEHYRNAKGLATAYAGLGDATRCLEQTDRMLTLDGTQAMADIATVATPYFQYAELRPAGIQYYERLQARLPAATWIAENIARLGRKGGSAADPKLQEARMTEGLGLLSNGNPLAAAAKFREVLAFNPTHYGATYQLATALDKSGQSAQARPLWEKVLAMAVMYKDSRTAETARNRLK
jgi:tetratricopeptide (TPR) repeat protein